MKNLWANVVLLWRVAVWKSRITFSPVERALIVGAICVIIALLAELPV